MKRGGALTRFIRVPMVMAMSFLCVKLVEEERQHQVNDVAGAGAPPEQPPWWQTVEPIF
jgi:hypothetical protein